MKFSKSAQSSLIFASVEWLDTYANVDLYHDEDFDPSPKATPDTVTFQLGIKTCDKAREFFAHVVKSLKNNGIPVLGVMRAGFNMVDGEDRFYILRAWISPTQTVVLSSNDDVHDWKLQLVNDSPAAWYERHCVESKNGMRGIVNL